MHTRLIPILRLSSSDQQAWRDLALRSAEPNPFCEADFVIPACRLLRGGKSVQLLVAEEGGRFHASLPVRPVKLIGIFPTPVISSWRHLYGFLGTPLVDTERGFEAVELLLRSLIGTGRRGRVIVLEQFGEDGPVAMELRQAARVLGLAVDVYSSGERSVLACAGAGPSDLPAPVRRERRAKARQWRRLRTDLGETTVVDRACDPDAADRFLALEASGWKRKAGTALACQPRDAAFYREVCRRFQANGALRVYSLDVGERMLAMQTTFSSGRALFDWKVAYDERFARYSPGTQLQLRVFELECDAGVDWIDSCSEVTDAHQLRISPDRRRIATLAIGRSGRFDRRALRAAVVVTKIDRKLRGLSARNLRHQLEVWFRLMTGGLEP
jgi:CelD/BcsL family acetyltransferase involved in cellulose biosynthesis